MAPKRLRWGGLGGGQRIYLYLLAWGNMYCCGAPEAPRSRTSAQRLDAEALGLGWPVG
jgi:hypothetical protein